MPDVQLNIELSTTDPLWAPLLAALAAQGLRHPTLAQAVTLRLRAEVYAGDPVTPAVTGAVGRAWPTAKLTRARRVRAAAAQRT